MTIKPFLHIDDSYEAFLNNLSILYNKYFPFVFSKQSQLYLQKPWITQCILISIKIKARYYKRQFDLKKKKSVYAISKYKCYKNKLTKIIKAAKSNYYLNKFEADKSDIKQTWQLLKNY